VTAFADSSALVKLYADEDGRGAVLGAEPLAVSQLARVEVPAALWRKHRIGEIPADRAMALTAEFDADYYGSDDRQLRFAAFVVGSAVLDEAALSCARYGLRAYDAVQLSCALSARRAVPGLEGFVVLDRDLRAAAAAEGFAVLPPGLVS
jgi:predicted nucleic acid-binding protein